MNNAASVTAERIANEWETERGFFVMFRKDENGRTLRAKTRSAETAANLVRNAGFLGVGGALSVYGPLKTFAEY